MVRTQIQLIAISCTTRDACPSCAGKRSAATTATRTFGC